MGIYDRDWYKEERKQARNGTTGQPRNSGSARPSPSPINWRSYFSQAKPTAKKLDPRATTPAQITLRAFGVFMLLCLAIFGALSLLQHFRGQSVKAPSTPTAPAAAKPTPKPPPEYHIKRAPTV